MVICRIGSLTEQNLKRREAAFVICRIGSLTEGEPAVECQDRVICRIGSLTGGKQIETMIIETMRSAITQKMEFAG